MAGTYAPFGNAIFSETLFGFPPTISVSTTINVSPSGYNGLQLNWTPPGGNWNQLVLVRSAFGTPSRVYDGITLESSPTFFGTYLDTPLVPGYFYYYSLFVFDTDLNEYALAGSAQGLVISDYDFRDTFQHWIPDWYLELDAEQATQNQPNGPLVRFLQLLGYEMDWIRSEMESIFLLTDVDLISGLLLPYMAGNFGVTYEPELGMTRSRVLIKNATYLYKSKGTIPGIGAAGSSFSGFGCKATIGPNLEIQLDDAAFDRSIGHWKHLTNSTITAQSTASLGVTPAHTAYNPANNSNVGVINVTAPGTWKISTCSSADVVTLGIPVSQAATPPMYVLSGYFQPAQQTTPTVRSVQAQIDWYDITGAFLSSSTGAAVTEVVDGWVRPYVAASPPAGAAFFGRTFLTSASCFGNEKHLIDAVQVEVNSLATPGPTTWDPPRDIKLNLLPQRQNLIANPAGVVGASGWSAIGATIGAGADLYEVGVLQDSPVGYWKLNEPNGTSAADSSSNVNAGTVHGTVMLGVAGPLTGFPSQTAYTFDGATGYVSIPHLAAYNPGSGSFAFGCFLNFNTSQANFVSVFGNGAASGQGAGWAVTIGFNVAPSVVVSDGTNVVSVGGPNLQDGKWHLVIGVIDRSAQVLRLYIDGSQYSTASISGVGAISNSSTVVGIGGLGNGGGQSFAGSVAQCGMYNGLLTAARVQSMWNSSSFSTWPAGTTSGFSLVASGPSLSTLTAAATSTSQAATTSASFTPAAGALVIVVLTAFTGSGASAFIYSISDTLGGLSWTKVERSIFSSPNATTTTIFTAFAPASPIAGTVTVTPSVTGSTGFGMVMEVVQVTNTAGVGATGVGSGASATLSQAPASTSLVLAANTVGLGSDPGVTQPTGFTALFTDTHAGTNSYGTVGYKNGSASQTVTFTNGSSNAATVVIEIQAPSSIAASFSGIPVNAGEVYSFTDYVEAVATGRSFQLQIQYLNGSGAVLQTFTSSSFSDVVGAFTQGDLGSAIAPTGAVTAKAILSISGITVGEQHIFGANLFEPAVSAGPYFDGNSAPAADYLWEGTPNTSISDYYPALQTKVSRLLAVMSEYIPIGSTFSINYGAAAFAALKEQG